MIVEAYRFGSGKKLVSIAWLEDNKIFLKLDKQIESVVMKDANEVVLNLWMKEYSESNNLVNIGKISLPKEDFDNFFEQVNNESKIVRRKKMSV